MSEELVEVLSADTVVEVVVGCASWSSLDPLEDVAGVEPRVVVAGSGCCITAS